MLESRREKIIKVKGYITNHPNAKLGEISKALGIPLTSVYEYKRYLMERYEMGLTFIEKKYVPIKPEYPINSE
jgi:predicted transcriptional regulator